MRSVVEANPTDHDWLQVSPAAPCPICGSGRSCRIHADEAFACCIQQPSDWRLSNGGWLHRVEPENEEVSELPVNQRMRESGIVVRDPQARWSSGVTAVGSST